MKFFVGKVEVLGKRVCACCALRIEFCRCNHSSEHFDTSCPNRKSTY